MTQHSVILFGCGDTGPMHPPIDKYSTLVRSTLASADIRFAQAERLYSKRGVLQVHAGNGDSRCDPAMASIFTDCGFDVVSVASNHAMDWGGDALLDTIDLFRERGIQTVGAGRNLDEARRPVMVERNGVTVAFLAYCSIVKEGYAATAKKPGVAPLRVTTSYGPAESQPGMPPKVITTPSAGDLAHMVEDIAAAKKSASTVVISMHWGLHYIPRMIADYQVALAEAAFKAGADVILGHHPHIPKAIAMHAGKPCFYSLGSFAMSTFARSPERAKASAKRYNISMDADYPNLPFGIDAKRSLIAKVVLGRDRIASTSFLPVQIDTQLRPEVLHAGDPRFADAVSYMDWASEHYPHQFTVMGDEVKIEQPRNEA